MSEYSGFKIKRPHSLAPLTSVYEAVAVDGRPGRFALKIFHPPASTHARRIYAIEGWLLAAERQKDAAKKDGSVLEVLACGRCEEGAFAVMPWQERYLEPWIKTLQQKGDTLRALATCLLNTIEAWEKETGGPHGNLKPANIFLDHSGPLTGMTARLSDPAFMPGTTTAALRLADLNAVGTMLATIVRRRLPGAWPIEEAPEWKALGNAGKGWLDFCNYLLNPQPGEGEVTLEKARLRLKKVPKDANPVKLAALTLAAVLVLSAAGILGFARFGNFNSMPDQIQRLAQVLNNPTVPKDIPLAWKQLCSAWDTWLIDLQSNAPRLVQTEELWDSDDKLRPLLADFVTTSKELLPATLVPKAASEKRLGVLANSPPDEVLSELQLDSVKLQISNAGKKLAALSTALESWARWDQLRKLQQRMVEKTYASAASALQSRLPPQRGSGSYKLDMARTLKFLNDLSLDNTGALPLASHWSEISRLETEMLANGEKGDRIQKEMPNIIIGRLVDMSSLSDFADSLMKPLEEMRLRRDHFNNQQVDHERFLKQSELLKGTEKPTENDFVEWEKELVAFTKVPRAEDPRFASDVDPIAGPPPATAAELETEAPEGESGNAMVTLSKSAFDGEFGGLQANLKTFQAQEIVRRDLPTIGEGKTELTGKFQKLLERLKYTLTLLKPETWLEKIKLPFGSFNATKQRWEEWKQAVVYTPGMTADKLRGKDNRQTFSNLRSGERTVKQWIDGVEGKTGFGALAPPDFTGTVSPDTATELKRLEAVLRDKAVTAVVNTSVNTSGWRNAVPVKQWADEGQNVRQPLEDHRIWLTQLPDFAFNLDELSKLLTNGYVYEEGVHAVAEKLMRVGGLSDLVGKPAEWRDEANQLASLAGVVDRGALAAATKGDRLSRKRMAWRKLGEPADWPSGAADFDLDFGVVAAMREIVRRELKDNKTRQAELIKELDEGTLRRFNRATRSAARKGDAELDKMFTRFSNPGLGLTVVPLVLDDPVAYNHQLWLLKKLDLNQKSLDPLGKARDTFVATVSAINGVKDQSEVVDFVNDLSKVELKDDPAKSRSTTSPETLKIGWREDYTDEGLGLKVTWKNGDKSVVLDYSIVQPEPPDETPPFYLANRAIAVGEFLDLMAGRPNEAKLVKAELPEWAKSDTPNKPWNMPIAWRPRSDFSGLELNIKSDANPKAMWIYKPDAQVLGLFDNTELRAATPYLDLAFKETPDKRSPLQQISPVAAKIFVEKILGARLPTINEWQAVIKREGGNATSGYLRGPNFQKLWQYTESYNVANQRLIWRPNVGIFIPQDPATHEKLKDNGQANATAEDNRQWFQKVDEGTISGKFVNLTGNVSIFLTGDKGDGFYVAGGSVLSPPGIDFTQPQKITASTTMIGAKAGSEAYSDVGIRPAFDAPYGFKQRYRLLVLVRGRKYLTL